jgi:MFS family permease
MKLWTPQPGPPLGQVLMPLSPLLAAVALVVIGVGLLFSVMGIRANLSNFSSLTLGLVMSAYYVGFLVGSYFAPWLIRRIGHIRAFAALASMASTMPILHAMWVNPWFWGGLRLLTGLCVIGMYVVIESWLNSATPSKHRGKVFGTYMIVCSVAGAVGQWLILVGDKMSFVPFALVAIVFSVALLPITLSPQDEPDVEAAPRFSLRRLFQVSPLGVVGVTAAGVLNGAFFGMGAAFAQGAGLSDNNVASFMGATLLGGALFQWPVGHYSDKHDRRLVLFWVCVVGAGVAAAAYLTSTMVRESMIEESLIFLGVLLGGMIFTVYGLSVAYVNDLIPPEEVVETSTGLLLMFGVGAVLGPFLAGLVMSATDNAGFMLFLSAVMGLVALYVLKRLPAAGPVPESAKADYALTGQGSPSVIKLDPRGQVPDSEDTP